MLGSSTADMHGKIKVCIEERILLRFLLRAVLLRGLRIFLGRGHRLVPLVPLVTILVHHPFSDTVDNSRNMLMSTLESQLRLLRELGYCAVCGSGLAA